MVAGVGLSGPPGRPDGTQGVRPAAVGQACPPILGTISRPAARTTDPATPAQPMASLADRVNSAVLAAGNSGGGPPPNSWSSGQAVEVPLRLLPAPEARASAAYGDRSGQSG